MSDVFEELVALLPRVGEMVGKRLVLKLGGSVGPQETVLGDLALLQRLGVRPVLVHGGGPLITAWLQRIGKETRFVDGLRYTDKETLDVVRMVLVGLVNNELVARLNGLGARAVGLSGVDGGLVRAVVRDPRLGLVGEPSAVDLGPMEALVDAGYLVVVAPIALGDGGQALNVNADTIAGELARALRAEQLIFFTDVPGLLDAEGRTIARLTVARTRTLMAEGIIRGGMIPKVEACVRALDSASSTHIVDGRRPHALLRALFAEESGGTMIVAD